MQKVSTVHLYVYYRHVPIQLKKVTISKTNHFLQGKNPFDINCLLQGKFKHYRNFFRRIRKKDIDL